MTQHLNTHDGSTHPLGCLPRETTCGDGEFPVLGVDEGTPDLLPRSTWDRYASTALESRVWHVFDQAPQNSCAACATAAGLMLLREKAGLTNVVLSEAPIYSIGNHGRDQGMAVDAGLKILRSTGTVPEEVIDGKDWKGRNWPDEWKDIARDYRAVEAWDCPTYKHAVSAVLRGFPVVIGVDWDDRRGAGHAILFIGWKDGRARIANSWGENWGEKGFGWLKESTCERGIPKYGAFALRVASDPKDDGDLPEPKFGMG